jgi:hypothetical protein
MYPSGMPPTKFGGPPTKNPPKSRETSLSASDLLLQCSPSTPSSFIFSRLILWPSPVQVNGLTVIKRF